MASVRKVLRIVFLPLRAAWFLVLVANFLVVAAVCLFFTSFVAYGIALALSYAFLPIEWTEALWQWAANLYAHSSWFKAATILFFMVLFLPILRFWPGRDAVADAAREREMMQLNDALIAARRQDELRAKLKA